jgi:hypothetical protein
MLCSATNVAAANCQALLPEFNQGGAATHPPAGAAAVVAGVAAGAAGAGAVVAGAVPAAGWFCALADIHGKMFKATIRTIPIKARARVIYRSPSSNRRLTPTVKNPGKARRDRRSAFTKRSSSLSWSSSIAPQITAQRGLVVARFLEKAARFEPLSFRRRLPPATQARHQYGSWRRAFCPMSGRCYAADEGSDVHGRLTSALYLTLFRRMRA